MTKVMLVITRMNIGGPSQHVSVLTDLLNRNDFQPLLIHGTLADGEHQFDCPQKGFNIYVPSLRREVGLGNDLKAFLKFLWLIRSERPQIIHTHMAKAGVLARLAGWLCGVPVMVHTYHGHVFDGYFSSWRTKVFLTIERFLGRRTHGLVAMGQEIARELVEKYNICTAEKIEVAYPGLDLAQYLNCERFKGELRKTLGLNDQVTLVAMIGRLSPVKRPQLFVEIAEEITKQRTDVKFLIIGGGEEESNILKMVTEKKLEQKVLLLGWKKEPHVIYADIDILFQCSSDEGTPHVLIEAQASSKSVVATRVGSIPEVVRDGKSGFLVGKDDKASMIRHLLLLIDNTEMRRQMGDHGREFVKEQFSMENLVEKMEKLYSRLLADKKPTVTIQ